ncbi:MAS protein, partial [Nycticryphes semicollaris]|nr:MAS protein [Nycticryphes semicollaris]
VMVPVVEETSSSCWSQPSGIAHNSSWHHRLLRQEDNDYNGTDCQGDHLSQVLVTLLICLCGLVGNGAVLWFLGSQVCRNSITTYVFNLAVANFTFLLFIAVALVIFYGPEHLCHRLGSRDVTTLLNITILFAFTTSVYLLTALSVTTALSLLAPSHCLCHRSRGFPGLLCVLLWALSFLLTLTVYLCPVALIIFVLSYLLSALTLTLSGLTLLARVMCSLWHHPPGMLSVVVLLTVFFFPFLTADFGYWLLLRLIDFSVFGFNTSLLLACINSTINPLIYFLVGCCGKNFTLSVRVAFQRALENVREPQNRAESPRENTVET